jgi:hypothetical protein
MLGTSGPKSLQTLNQTGTRIVYGAIVRIRPRAGNRFTSMDSNYEILRVQPGATQDASVGMLGVVISEQGIPDDGTGSVATMGGPVTVTVDCRSGAVNGVVGTRVSQYDLLMVPSQSATAMFRAGRSRLRKWNFTTLGAGPGAGTLSAGDLSGSYPLQTTQPTTFSRINQSVNSLRLEVNKLMADIAGSSVVNNNLFSYVRTVRAMYIGSGTLTASNASAQVVLLNAPLTD